MKLCLWINNIMMGKFFATKCRKCEAMNGKGY